VIIRNLQSIAQAAAKTALATKGLHADDVQETCFVQLLAVLAADPETIDIRFKHPQRKTNNVIKGIVQAKERTQKYPYLAKGLDGSGQVVGLVSGEECNISCVIGKSVS
jgi:hypothetical protein